MPQKPIEITIALLVVFTAGIIGGFNILSGFPEAAFVNNSASVASSVSIVGGPSATNPTRPTNSNFTTSSQSAGASEKVVAPSLPQPPLAKATKRVGCATCTSIVGLSYLSNDSRVVLLQQLLKVGGFFPADADTSVFFGPKTLEALRAFQIKNGLPETGTVDQLTRDALTESFPASARMQSDFFATLRSL